MSDSNSVARVLVVLLLGALVALFAAMAIDMAVPTPIDPWTTFEGPEIPAAQQAELEQRRDEIDTQLSKKEITQDQADALTARVDSDESVAWESVNAGPDVAASDAFSKATENRGLTVGGIAAGLVALMLAAGVFLTRGGRALGEVPLFSGAFLGVYGMWAAGPGSGMNWVGIAVTGLIASGTLAAGLSVFTRTPQAPTA